MATLSKSNAKKQERTDFSGLIALYEQPAWISGRFVTNKSCILYVYRLVIFKNKIMVGS